MHALRQCKCLLIAPRLIKHAHRIKPSHAAHGWPRRLGSHLHERCERAFRVGRRMGARSVERVTQIIRPRNWARHFIAQFLDAVSDVQRVAQCHPRLARIWTATPCHGTKAFR